MLCTSGTRTVELNYLDSVLSTLKGGGGVLRESNLVDERRNGLL